MTLTLQLQVAGNCATITTLSGCNTTLAPRHDLTSSSRNKRSDKAKKLHAQARGRALLVTPELRMQLASSFSSDLVGQFVLGNFNNIVLERSILGVCWME